MMPVPVSRVASVGADKEVILRFIDEVNSAKVPFIKTGNCCKPGSYPTCFIDGIKAQMSLLSFSRVSGWAHDHPLHIAQASLIITVIRICIQAIL